MSITVTLPDDMADFVNATIRSGRHATASEVVGEALRLLKVQRLADTDKLAWLRAAIQEGIDSGDAGELDFDAIRREGEARLVARRGVG